MTLVEHPARHLVRSVVSAGDVVKTLSDGKPNWITAIDNRGVYVETEKSRREEAGARLVPWWMFQTAWDRLLLARMLTNVELLHELNVKRSSAVFAILALLPEVDLVRTRPLTLALRELP